MGIRGTRFRNTVACGDDCPRIMNEKAGGRFCTELCGYLAGTDGDSIICGRPPLERKDPCISLPEDRKMCHSGSCLYFHSCRTRERRKAVSPDKTLHRTLCEAAGRWLHSRKSCEPWETPWKYAAVELVTWTGEIPDAWATNGLRSCVIEAKTSHQDFLADQRKYTRQKENVDKGKAFGNYRYYLCPDGVISPDELPQGWGLLYWDGKAIRIIRRAERTDADAVYDVAMLTSIMRRLGVKEQTFDFRKSR